MRKPILLLVTMAVSIGLVTGVASAITYGQLDGDRHPNVGTFVLEDELGKFVACTGTLIAPKVFLTAAHCTWGIEQGVLAGEIEVHGVTFDSVYDPGTSVVYPGTIRTHPGYPGKSSYVGVGADPNDIAVVELAEEITDSEPALLPSAGLLDRGLKGQSFTVVGYGYTELTHERGSGAPVFGDAGTRRYSVSSFQALDKSFLRLAQNPSTGDGGACYRDSGGPNFLGAGEKETNVIASIGGLMGDIRCRSMNSTYRLDTPAARAFLEQFVTLP